MALLAAGNFARAETVYWDTNGATDGSGNASGTWDAGTTANWSLNSAGTVDTRVFNAGDAAVFSAGTDNVAATTVTVAGKVTPLSLTFNSQLTNFTVASLDADSGLDFGSATGAFNSSVFGTGISARQMYVTANLFGSAGITIAAHGNLTATGGGNSSYFQLGGNNASLTGGIAITSGLVDVLNNTALGSNVITLSNNAGLLDANHSVTVANNIELAAGGASVIRTWGTATTTFSGVISGAGGLNFTDTGTRLLTGTNTYTGATQLLAGNLQLGNDTATGSIATSSSLSVPTGTTLRVRRSGSVNLSSLVPSSFSLVGTLEQRGALATDELVISGPLGVDNATGTLRTLTSQLTINSGADVKVATLQATGGAINLAGGAVNAGTLVLTSTPSNSATASYGTFNISGGSLTTRYLNVGAGTNTSGVINQTGGLITVVAGGDAIRIGHWDSGTITPPNRYDLSGGTLDASAVVMNVGWDGAAIFNVSGTGLAKVQRLYVDAAGVDRAAVVNLQTGGTIEIGSGGTASDNTSGSMLNLAGGTLRSVASGTWASRMDANSGTTSTINAASGTRINFTGLLSGTGDINQTGTGEVAYIHAGSTFSGHLTADAGIVSGTGTLGRVTVGGTVAPGASSAAGAIGKLTVGANASTFTLNGKAAFDLNGASTSTGNDLIDVQGDLTFGSGATITPAFYGATPAVGNSYTLMSYAGTLSGTPTIDPATTSTIRLGLQLDTTTVANQILLNVTSGAADLVWAGDGAANLWDVNTTANWMNAGSADKFFNYDGVQLTDAGNNTTPITLNGTVLPVAMTVAADKDYTIAGTGSIGGGATFTKSGTGTLNLLTNNTLGTISIAGGTVNVGNGGTSGSIDGNAAITLAEGTTLRINRSDAVTLSRPFASTSTGTLVKAGTGNLTNAFMLLPQFLTIDGGTFTATGGGFGGNRMVGNGVITVNAGGTIVIPAGNFHAFGGDNGNMTESFVFNGGAMTINQEQYFKNLTLSGATISGTGEVRASAASNFQVTGSTPSTISAPVAHIAAANWTVADVTSSPAVDVVLSGLINGGGALNKSGPGTMRLTGNNAYGGVTSVNGGTLLANGALVRNTSNVITNSATGTGAVNVNNGGTIGGTGHIGGAVTVNLGGTIAPGESIGTLSIANSLILGAGGTGDAPAVAIELGEAGTSDKITLTGTNSAGVLNLDSLDQLKLFVSHNVTTPTTYTIASFASVSGIFDVVSINGQLAQDLDPLAANYVKVDYNPSDIQVTVNSVVPEPGSALLLAPAAGLLALRRRRRR